jgi:hypothetical protein
MHSSASTRIFAFGVLAYAEDVKLGCLQRAVDPWEQAVRSNVGILGKLLADRQQESVQRHGIGYYRGPADCAKQNSVELLQRLDAVSRHHRARFLVERAGPRKSSAIERKARTLGGNLKDRPCGLRHVVANAIARNECDRIVLHGGSKPE